MVCVMCVCVPLTRLKKNLIISIYWARELFNNQIYEPAIAFVFWRGYSQWCVFSLRICQYHMNWGPYDKVGRLFIIYSNIFRTQWVQGENVLQQMAIIGNNRHPFIQFNQLTSTEFVMCAVSVWNNMHYLKYANTSSFRSNTKFITSRCQSIKR